MAAIATRPKVLGVRPRPCFTLHTTNVNVFTVQEKCTAVLSFRRKKDAIHFGRILEAKFALDKEWPVVQFLQSNDWYVKHTSEHLDLSRIFVTEWDTDDLHSVCINHNFPIVDVENVLINQDRMNMKGSYISWDLDPNFYKEYFENVLHSNETSD